MTQRKTLFGEGVFIVGTDVEPGTYVHDADANCSWFRLSGFGLPHDRAIAQGNGSDVSVTILASDAGFESIGCGIWTKATDAGSSAAGSPAGPSPSPTRNVPTQVASPTLATSTGPVAIRTFGDGAYRVGADIPPGTYRTVEGGNLYGCQWEVDVPGGSVRANGVGGIGFSIPAAASGIPTRL